MNTSRATPSIHQVKQEHSHLAWDNSIPPVVTVASGESVTFSCLDASNGQVTPSSTTDSISNFDFSRLDQVNGPVYITGARPGDVLQVDVVSVSTADWGWTAIIPGFGLLADEFPTPALKIWSLDEKDKGWAWFDKEKGIKVPLKPFAGEMGVALAEAGAHSTIPPRRVGGNMDTRHLVEGARLWLPVEVEGALFSVGDGHAAQGDGEVCGTAIETPMQITLRFTTLPPKPYLSAPQFLTTSSLSSSSSSTINLEEKYYTTTGVGPDIQEATRNAVRAMIGYLAHEQGLTHEEAYMLCSVAGDLRLHEVVDMPNYVVGMMMPLSVFGHTS